MIAVEIAKKVPFSNSSEFAKVSGNQFPYNYGNLGGHLKTRHDDAFGEKTKGDLYH